MMANRFFRFMSPWSYAERVMTVPGGFAGFAEPPLRGILSDRSLLSDSGSPVPSLTALRFDELKAALAASDSYLEFPARGKCDCGCESRGKARQPAATTRDGPKSKRP